jgi:hypothetical protein
MNFGGSRDESIASLNRPTRGFAPGHQPATCVPDPQVNWKDSSFKTRDQIFPQPTIEMFAALPGSESFNAIA